mmetsp:Transcript_11445/g.29751  ORF Transcript_11445/g.29751 Transcript_11445/m.29751 type:complete len:262 (-) Transcript_11445:932-1717(-)
MPRLKPPPLASCHWYAPREVMLPACPRSSAAHLFVRKSHTLMEWSREPEKMSCAPWPYGEPESSSSVHTQCTERECACTTDVCRPVVRSHTRTVWSTLPETRCPRPHMVMHMTACEWPSSMLEAPLAWTVAAAPLVGELGELTTVGTAPPPPGALGVRASSSSRTVPITPPRSCTWITPLSPPVMTRPVGVHTADCTKSCAVGTWASRRASSSSTCHTCRLPYSEPAASSIPSAPPSTLSGAIVTTLKPSPSSVVSTRVHG